MGIVKVMSLDLLAVQTQLYHLLKHFHKKMQTASWKPPAPGEKPTRKVMELGKRKSSVSNRLPSCLKHVPVFGSNFSDVLKRKSSNIPKHQIGSK